MLTASQKSIAQGQNRRAQWIAWSLIVGTLSFAGIIGATISDWGELDQPLKLMSTLAAASTLLFLGLSGVAPGIFPTLPVRLTDTQNPETQNQAVKEIGGLLSTQTFMRLAMFAACIFVNLMPLMFEPRWINVVCGIVGLTLIVFFFPYRNRCLATIEKRFAQWKEKTWH